MRQIAFTATGYGTTDDQRIEFTVQPHRLSGPEAEKLRVVLASAIRILMMLDDDCRALLGVTAETRARDHRDRVAIERSEEGVTRR